MDRTELETRFARLTTAHIADGCLRAGVDVRCAPSGLAAIEPGMRLAGRALPAQHVGSVDVFLEAFGNAEDGDVLVVDNRGGLDESCVGDLVTLEAKGAGLSGILIWGLNRDTVDIRAIGFPVFSLGTIPTGPIHFAERPADALTVATVDGWTITGDDMVFGDEDGVLFVPAKALDAVLDCAEAIRDTERAQAERIAAGDSLRGQVRFDEYLAARELNPALTFREHLRAVGGAIEV
jgi:regulator of RNase E activity RraA